MPEYLISFSLSDAEWRQEGQCVLWFFHALKERLPTSLGNGTGQPRGVGRLTRTLTREDRVLDLTG